MQKFMDWMANSFAPRMNKIARNPWVASIQEALLTCMPIVFIGSFATIIGIITEFVEGFPSLGPISDFSMGLFSVFLAFLIPYNIMDKKKHRKIRKEAAIVGVALFLMLCGPTFSEEGAISFIFWNLGSGGMLAALIAGLFSGFIMNLFSSFSFFKKDTSMPDFITIWFDTLIPMLIILTVGWLIVFVFNINMFAVIEWVFSPIATASDSIWGFVLFYFIAYAFFYSFGISTWLLASLEYAIILPNFALNEAAVAAGSEATKIMAYGSSYYFLLGGGGVTLALGLMFLFFSKSKKNKLIGKTTLLPNLANINEPLVFGAPIAFNPILMIPMWIIGIIGPLVTYLALYWNLVPKPSVLFSFWYLPAPIPCYFVGGFRGVLLFLVIFVISALVYYPFFKVYDKQCIEEEAAKEKEEK